MGKSGLVNRREFNHFLREQYVSQVTAGSGWTNLELSTESVDGHV